MSAFREPTEAELALGKCVMAALNNFPTRGSGLLMMNGQCKHWKLHFADALETLPGAPKIDRDSLFPTPKKRRVAK